MANIKINENMLRSNSKAIEVKIQELNEMNQRLNSVITRIEDSWEGDASIAYVNMMQNYAKQAEEMVTVLNEFKSYVDSAVTKFENMDKSAASKLRNSF